MTEERLKKLEKSVQQLARRSPSRALAVIPPAVVSFYINAPEEDGTLCTFVAPFNGIVKAVAFNAGEIKIAEGMMATVSHKGAMRTQWDIPVKYHRFVEESSYVVSPGDLITLSITNPDVVRKISVSLVVEPAEGNMEKLKVDLNRLLEESSDA